MNEVWGVKTPVQKLHKRPSLPQQERKDSDKVREGLEENTRRREEEERECQ